MGNSRLMSYSERHSSHRGIILLRIVFSLFSITASLAGEQQWSSFRGPASSGRADGFATPLKWNIKTSEHILWKTPIPGLGHSAPIVWNDYIFVTTAVEASEQSELKVGLYGDIQSVIEGESFSWHVICLDRKTGNIVWDRIVYSGKPKVKRHPKSSHANSTPCTNGKYVIAFFGSEGLYCYDFKGNLVWKKDLGVLDWGYFRFPSAQWGGASSPVIHGQMVIIQCDVQKDSFLAAYHLKDGSLIWKTPREEIPTWSTPTVYTGRGHPQIIVNGYKHIGGYDIETGKEIWKMKGGGDIPVPTPIVSEELIFITNAHGRMSPVFAVKTSAQGDISLAKDASQNEYIVWSIPKSGNYMTTPIVYEDLLFCCSDRGRLSCFEATTGTLHYSEELSSSSVAFSASPVAAEEKIYFTSEKGGVYVVKAGHEFELLVVNQMEETCMATPAIYQECIYFRTRNHLVAIGE